MDELGHETSDPYSLTKRTRFRHNNNASSDELSITVELCVDRVDERIRQLNSRRVRRPTGVARYQYGNGVHSCGLRRSNASRANRIWPAEGSNGSRCQLIAGKSEPCVKPAVSISSKRIETGEGVDFASRDTRNESSVPSQCRSPPAAFS